MKILLIGYGKINQLIHENYSDEVVGIYDINKKEIYDLPDVIIDFSNEAFLYKTIEAVCDFMCPLVIGTTNYNLEQVNRIKEMSKVIPILMSNNFSLGINLINSFLKNNKDRLTLFHKEIIETHHNLKADSPSGTAKLLAKSLNTDNITSVRIGDVIGIHEVILETDYEAISINHVVNNRLVFVDGAVMAARWLVNQKPGFYHFEEIYERS